MPIALYKHDELATLLQYLLLELDSSLLETLARIVELSVGGKTLLTWIQGSSSFYSSGYSCGYTV
jgi:hypothetical protein